jgi:4-amino-4-deoxy-L-arabinose transferase-like glycosyltransferase
VKHRSRLIFWSVAAAAAVLLFLRLGTPYLIDPDEARFARTTVEMIRSGDLVVPSFQGVPRTVKPPLLHWAQAACFRFLHGPSELGARLPAALATLGTMFLLAWVTRRRFGDEGAIWSSAIFITLPLVVVLGRVGTTDALLSVHVFAALAIDMAEYGETGGNRGGVMGALLGLAFLAKGPIGVILPVLMILAGRTAAGRNVVPHWRAVLTFVAGWSVVALPWSLVFLNRVSTAEVVRTLRTEVFARYFAGTEHVQPPWYFAAVVLVAFAPWVAPLVVALIRVIGLRRDPVARTGLYAAAAFLAALLFLSFGRGKLPQYILPAAPMAALLVTWGLGRELSAPREHRTGSLLLTGALLVETIVLSAAGAVFPMEGARQAAAAGAAAYAVGALVAVWGLLRQKPRLVYGAAAGATALFLLAGVIVLHPALGAYRSAGPLVDRIPELASDRPTVLVDIRQPSLTYYQDRAPERITSEELASRLERPDEPVIVIASDDIERVPMPVLAGLREIGRSGKLHVFVEGGGAGPAGSESIKERPSRRR